MRARRAFRWSECICMSGVSVVYTVHVEVASACGIMACGVCAAGRSGHALICVFRLRGAWKRLKGNLIFGRRRGPASAAAGAARTGHSRRGAGCSVERTGERIEAAERTTPCPGPDAGLQLHVRKPRCVLCQQCRCSEISEIGPRRRKKYGGGSLAAPQPAMRAGHRGVRPVDAIACGPGTCGLGGHVELRRPA